MALDFGTVTFRNARESGVEVSLLGSGQYDHLGFFGPDGAESAVEVGSFQDNTIIVDSNGLENPAWGPFGGSGFCTNAKSLGDPNTVELSGLPNGPGEVNIVDVNRFEAANLNTEPFFGQIPSGTLLIEYRASGVSEVHTYNAKFYAYDNTGTVNDAPPDVTVQAFEINASGQWRNAAHSGVWRTLQGRGTALEFTDHSKANGWVKRNLHVWVTCITVKPNAVGILDEFDFAFETQFA